MVLKCFHCNGYYGSAFGQPVCSTCHMFLYPDDSSGHSFSQHLHEMKVEDGDSGNEEPREPPDGAGVADAVDLADPPTAEAIANCSDDSVPLNHAEASNRLSPRGGNNIAVELSPGDGRDVSLRCDRLSPRLGARFDRLHHWEEPTLTAGSADIDSIPPEVLLQVFKMLDEVSLWSVSQVCRRWNQLVRGCALQWKEFIRRKWPLFNPICLVNNWHKVFINLIESAPCQLCLFKMPAMMALSTHDNSWRRKRLSNECRTLKSDPPEGINAFPLDKMSLHWQASIRGPAGSPYQGGTFFLYIEIPSKYPLNPPLVRFVTRIFHPNVSRHGDIGIDSIQHNWSVAISISKVLVSIQSLLTDPYTNVCMETRIGEIYEANYPQFCRMARAWTWCYAMHDAIDADTVVPDFLNKLLTQSVSRV